MKKFLLIFGALAFTSCGDRVPEAASQNENFKSNASSSRSIGALNQDGEKIEYYIHQLIIKDDHTGKLENWLASNKGSIIDNGDIPAPPIEIDPKKIRPVSNSYRLVEIDGSLLKNSKISAQKINSLQFSNLAAKQTFAASLSAQEVGLESSLNYVMKSQAAVDEEEGAVNGVYQPSGSFWHLKSWPGSNSFDLFDRGYKGQGVGIAILDNGLKADYEIFGESPAGGKTTYSPVYQYDFVTNSYTLANSADYDSNGQLGWHGLRAAQTALGRLGNRMAGTGSAPAAQAYLFRIGENGSISFWNAGRAVNTAVSWGAGVISMSFGGWAAAAYDGGNNFASALSAAANSGVINIASAGNDGKYSSKERAFGNVFVPAAWNSVIGVGAIDSTGAHSVWGTQSSNYGPVAEIWAGGSNIGHAPDPSLPCWSNEQCAYTNNGLAFNRPFSGTSAAGPVVAGVAALMKQANPNLNVWDAKRILQNTSDKRNGDWILDARAAVRQVVIEKGGSW